MQEHLWKEFNKAALLQSTQSAPIALIVDSPWLANHVGLNTLDYFLFPEKRFQAYLQLIERFPDVLWTPDYWVEYGMAIEPSAFGARMHFHQEYPPSIEPVISSPEHWAHAPLPDVAEDGLMPLALRQMKHYEEWLAAEGMGLKMAAARGPLVTASWVMGVSQLMTGILTHPKEIQTFLGNITTTIIAWLRSQLDTMRDPGSIMLLDDIVGMISPEHFHEFAEPHLQRIFEEFDGLIRIYHNDTPALHLYPLYAAMDFEVFNFTHVHSLSLVRELTGGKLALMGNVAPLDIMARKGPAEVRQAVHQILNENADFKGVIMSVGGGVSPGTTEENIDAMVAATQDWLPGPDSENKKFDLQSSVPSRRERKFKRSKRHEQE